MVHVAYFLEVLVHFILPILVCSASSPAFGKLWVQLPGPANVLFIKIGHEIFSTEIFSLLLIKEGQLTDVHCL